MTELGKSDIRDWGVVRTDGVCDPLLKYGEHSSPEARASLTQVCRARNRKEDSGSGKE